MIEKLYPNWYKDEKSVIAVANWTKGEKSQDKIFDLNIKMRLINHVILNLVTLALHQKPNVSVN